jgi:asparagine synthase (glutamine-hydrolysing)
MCGIAGIYFLKDEPGASSSRDVIESLRHRGPDHQDHLSLQSCNFFHARLSIVDLSNSSNQPFVNETKTKALTFNGEIFNYKQLAAQVQNLKTNGDVEVLFKLFEKENTSCLNKLNGFFSFSFYNSETDELDIVRDRYGVKPLYYYHDNEKIAFASELKPLLHLCGPQELNQSALYTYLRLNYISGKETIFKNIYRLLPGEFISVKNKKVTVSTWYQLPLKKSEGSFSALLEDSVKLRLQADVPVACFLSGGIDSSIISALAKKHHDDLHTFSLGFADEPFFDETEYAEKVAAHIKSKHHVFKLKNTDLLEHIHPFLNSIDEPFADSSAFNVYVLSKHTVKHAKVALSGDGADELFMGYNKHKAELLQEKFLYNTILPLFNPVLELFGSSRNSGFSNKVRQAKRFADAVKLDPMHRYMEWASISNGDEVEALLKKSFNTEFENIFSPSFQQKKFNPVNHADLNVVLADDMLVKADRMSMQHGLEIRNPFLDYRVVEYAMNLPMENKISEHGQKLILRKEFKSLLPEEIFTRKKKGFELPLWNWLNHELKQEIETKWLSKDVIEEQNLFSYPAVKRLKEELFSSDPGDAPAKTWALIVFQNWYTNFKPFIKFA